MCNLRLRASIQFILQGEWGWFLHHVQCHVSKNKILPNHPIFIGDSRIGSKQFMM